MSESARGHGCTVVGGGMVGPVAAMALVRDGFGPVEVLERRRRPGPEPEQPGRSVHVILSARGWRMLREIGADERVRELCLPLAGRMVHLDGGDVQVQPYSSTGERIWCVDRHQLNRVLTQAAEETSGVEVRYGTKVLEVDPDAPAVRTADGWQRCHRILGCDGVHSAVRTALVERGAGQSVERLGLGYTELTVGAADSHEWPWDRHHFQVWPRGGRMFSAFAGQTGGFTGSLFLPYSGDGDTFESLTSAAVARELFERLIPEVLPHLADLEGEIAGHPVNRLTVARCDTWVWQDKVVLAGDACHAMAPFMGQGMNCGFEDIRVLVDNLREHEDWGAAFAAYETMRRPDTDAITEISSRHYENLANPPAQSAADIAGKRCRELLAQRFPERFRPLYEQCAFSEKPYARILRQHEAAERLVGKLVSEHGAAVGARAPAELAELAKPLIAADDILRADDEREGVPHAVE